MGACLLTYVGVRVRPIALYFGSYGFVSCFAKQGWQNMLDQPP